MKKTFNLPSSAQKTAFIGTLVLILLLLTAGTAFAETPAVFSSATPAPGSIKANYDSYDWNQDGDYFELVNVSVIVTDPDGISSTLPPGTNWQRPEGYSGSVWNTQVTILNSTQALLTATLSGYWGMPGGQQTMTMVAKDNLGNINTYTWSFIYDNNNPTASNLTPEVTENKRQTVSANITDTLSGINQTSITMTVDGTPVTPTKTAITNGYTVSYTPASDFSLGTHNVVLNFKDNGGRAGSKNFSFIVVEPNTAPLLLSFSPGENANQLLSEDGYLDDFGYWVVTGTYFNFSAQVVDLNGIKSGSQSLILKNMKTAATTTVAPTLSYSNAEQTKASLSKKFSNYNEGVYQLNFTVQDNTSPTSQTLNKVWNFNLYKDFPTASIKTPADQSKTSNLRPTISARVTDATSGIDPASIAMKVDNQQIPTESISKVAVSNGYDVSYVPQDDLLSGLHTVELTYKDNGGIAGSSTWSFTVQVPKPPELVSITPTDGSTAGPNVNIEAKFFADDEMDSTAGSYTMSIKYPDGTTHPVTPSFTNSYYDPDIWDWVTMPKYGSIKYTADLPEGGPYEVTVTAKAKNGLQASKTWSFGAYKDLPTVTNVTLAGKSYPNDSIPDVVLTETKPAMAARITDVTSGIDQSTISVKIDGVAVPQAAFTAIPCANGFDVLYTPSNPLAVYQLHTVTFVAKDNKGFESSKGYPFFISQAPVASNVTPQDGSSLTDGEPNISVHFADSFEELDTATITIDGKNVTPTVTYSSNKKDADVSWKGVLASGAHNIQVSITSKHTLRSLPDETSYFTGGLTTTVNWSFTTTGYTDMTHSAEQDQEACLSCHGGAVYTPDYNANTGTWLNEPNVVDFSSIHDISLNYHGPLTCNKCHWSNENFTANTGSLSSKKCNLCHVDPRIDGSMPYIAQNPVHSSFKNFTFSDHNNASKYLITAPRTANDCAYCHAQPNTATLKIGATTGSNRHDLVNGHKVNFPDNSCQKCHNNILTREHAAAGRTDTNGIAMNCGSCHNNGSVKGKIPNYQPVSNGGEYSFPGKKITGARVNTYIQRDGVVTVEGYYNGTWNNMWSKSIDIFDASSTWGDYGYPEVSGDFPITYPYTFDATWATPVEKVRVVMTAGGQRSGAELDNFVITPEDNITCSTCHPNADHAALHETGLVTDQASPQYWECSTCHKANLMNEHTDNPATQTKTLDCYTCHENTDPEQAGKNEQVIAFGQKLCSDCHDLAHSQYMVSSVPSIIPVNPSFKWAAPMEAKLFASESWVPDEAVNNNAKVLISSRLNSVTGDNVWTWYQTKMQEQGWTVASGAPSANSNYYTVTFTKGTKKAILWFYGGENHTAGPVLPAGYRVEMIYYDTAQ